MSNQRDFWDKANRQKKTWKKRSVPHGPAPLAGDLRRIKERLLKKAAAERAPIEQIAKAEWRRFKVSALVSTLLENERVNTAAVVNAVKSVLGSDSVNMRGIAARFWLYNREVEQISEQGTRIGARVELKRIPEEFRPWLLKFKRRPDAV